jgi:hypothetical protein
MTDHVRVIRRRYSLTFIDVVVFARSKTQGVNRLPNPYRSVRRVVVFDAPHAQEVKVRLAKDVGDGRVECLEASVEPGVAVAM